MWRDWNYGLDPNAMEVVPDLSPEEAADLERRWFAEDRQALCDDVNMAYIQFLRERRRYRAELEDQRLYGVFGRM